MARPGSGGKPLRPQRLSIDSTGQQVVFEEPVSYLQISNEGSNELRLYFYEEDFTADANYITLAATTGWFSAPVQLIYAEKFIWLRTSSGTSDPVVVLGLAPR